MKGPSLHESVPISYFTAKNTKALFKSKPLKIDLQQNCAHAIVEIQTCIVVIITFRLELSHEPNMVPFLC